MTERLEWTMRRRVDETRSTSRRKTKRFMGPWSPGNVNEKETDLV